MDAFISLVIAEEAVRDWAVRYAAARTASEAASNADAPVRVRAELELANVERHLFTAAKAYVRCLTAAK